MTELLLYHLESGDTAFIFRLILSCASQGQFNYVCVSEAGARFPRLAAGSSQTRCGNLLELPRKLLFWRIQGPRAKVPAVFRGSKKPFCHGHFRGAGDTERAVKTILTHLGSKSCLLYVEQSDH